MRCVLVTQAETIQFSMSRKPPSIPRGPAAVEAA
jgi:hypothetical protein